MRILFLDDSKTTQVVMGQVLRFHRHEVLTASDPDEARQLMAEYPFDLVITDLNMPGTDGIAFARSVRRTPGFETVPILLMTSEFDPALTRKAHEAGIDLFVEKTFSPNEMAEAIQKAVQRIERERGPKGKAHDA